MPGRRRDQRLDDVIVRAALEAIAEEGYRRFGMETVAARAGVPKSTVYKRWPNRSALAAGALAAWLTRMAPTRPEQNDPLASLVALVDEEIGISRRPEGRVAAQLALAPDEDANDARGPLVEALAGRRGRLVEALRVGQESGVVAPGADIDLATDLLIGAVWAPALSGRPGAARPAADIVDAVLALFGSPRT